MEELWKILFTLGHVGVPRKNSPARVYHSRVTDLREYHPIVWSNVDADLRQSSYANFEVSRSDHSGFVRSKNHPPTLRPTLQTDDRQVRLRDLPIWKTNVHKVHIKCRDFDVLLFFSDNFMLKFRHFYQPQIIGYNPEIHNPFGGQIANLENRIFGEKKSGKSLRFFKDFSSKNGFAEIVNSALFQNLGTP